jgi:hypothetical protein
MIPRPFDQWSARHADIVLTSDQDGNGRKVYAIIGRARDGGCRLHSQLAQSFPNDTEFPPVKRQKTKSQTFNLLGILGKEKAQGFRIGSKFPCTGFFKER